MTTATLQHCPARVVPPPRGREAPDTSASGDGLDHVVQTRGDDDADRHLAVVGGVGRVEGPVAVVEADLALEALAKVGGRAWASRVRLRAGDLIGRSSPVAADWASR